MTNRRVVHALLALAALFLAGSVATARADAAPAGVPAASEVFERVARARASGRPALAIFGLDGTLLDPAARTREIFALAFDGPDPVVNPPRPDLVTAIRALPLPDYGTAPESTLARIGVTDSAFVRAVVLRWNQDFWSNRFLSRDEAVPGAVGFVDSLHARGCTIVYLSPRDARRMLAGTAQSLLERGFPVGDARTMLVLKPNRTTPDAAFRSGALDDLAASGSVVAVFEGDAAALDQMRARFPDALAVRLAPRGDAGAPVPGIETRRDFTEIAVP